MSDLARRKIAASVARHGWPVGLEVALHDMDRPEETRRVQAALWLRHTAWKALFDPSHRTTAWVLESGYGSLAISLARDFSVVHAYCDNSDTAQITRARAEWLGLHNIVFETTADMPELCDAAAIYGVPGKDTIREAHARLAPHGRLYVALPARNGHLQALRTERQLRRLFSSVTAYRCETDGDLEETYELTPGTSPASLRSILRTPAFGLLACKSARSESLIASVLERGSEQLCENSALEPERIVFACPNGLTVITREAATPRRFVIRIPLDPMSVERNETNQRALQAAAKLEPSLQSAAPHHVLSGSIEGYPYFIETGVTGQTAGSFLARGGTKDEAFKAALDWITDLHVQTAKRCMPGGEPVKRLVLEPLDRAFKAFRCPEWKAGFDRLALLLIEALRGSGLPLVFSH
ncbi:MAG TPA: hypothetical protein VHA11_11385, partial [Bryobacteraceae bacterium]|nr:hypothetical protein [Bryobacteraceae bacterium]